MSAAALAANFGAFFVVSLTSALSPGPLAAAFAVAGWRRIIGRRVCRGLLAALPVALAASGLVSEVGYAD